ncbi:MAG: helix-turn-helix domain-containing protein [Acidobacteria bacterium]|nr:helix-turn-helix domain-containing protein [Acidobacteriota bacterium]MCI0718129.1 helix-turn-helix domain-containing protein [Acidobacteriota bacterium]
MQRISQQFLIRLKLGGIRQYKAAQKAKVDPTTLSKLVSGAERVKPHDPRILAVGAVLGLKPEECFESLRNETLEKPEIA